VAGAKERSYPGDAASPAHPFCPELHPEIGWERAQERDYFKSPGLFHDWAEIFALDVSTETTEIPSLFDCQGSLVHVRSPIEVTEWVP
jgi:hypothetical protein